MLKYVDRGIQVTILILILFCLLTVNNMVSNLTQVKNDVVELTTLVTKVATTITAEDFAAKQEAVTDSVEGISDAVTDTKNRFLNNWNSNGTATE